MNFWQALLLGIVQGITEFLPISSSGHLKIVQYLFGFEGLSQFLLFDLVCHLGTLFAIIWVFKKEIYAVLTSSKKCLQIAIAILPLFPLALFLKPIESLIDQPRFLAFGFFVTAFLLYFCRFFSEQKEESKFAPLFIGLFQAIAVIPGISRSGATIASGKFMGLSAKESASFSFLIAIPAILGGAMLQGGRLFFSSGRTLSELSLNLYLIGFFSSFLVGLMALKVMRRLIVQNRLTGFSLYCFLLGLALIIYFR